ncbi:MAG: peptidoglycan DD-metalloendopeptidase family protein [Bacteroidota bacterium]|nr:peptidoglycan DD-metalloendopeptidase family protein [Bacteroidota bacterium]
MIESVLEKVIKFLSSSENIFAPILEIPLSDENIHIIDLSNNNVMLQDIKLEQPEDFTALIFDHIKSGGAKVGIGGYLENRTIYNQSENFNGEERRTIHLGIDIWAPEGTVVYAPLQGSLHSFNNNKGLGNYGPTIVLEHNIKQFTFFTLYGHLSEQSLDFIKEGETVKQGSLLGRIGSASVNGGWPPHLHFQIITDMQGFKGDFPGVAAPSKVDYYSKICPDPNLILKVKKL